MTNYKAKMSKEDLDSYLRGIYAEGHSMKTAEITGVVYKDALAYYGGWKTALTSLDLRREESKLRTSKIKRTPDEIKSELINALAKGYRKVDIHKKEPALYTTILRNYGSIEHFANTCGLDLTLYGFKIKENYRIKEKVSFKTKEIMSRHEIDEFIKELLNLDAQIDASYLLLHHPVEFRSLKHHYGSLADAFSVADVYVLDKKVPRKWSEDFLFTQIKLGFSQDKPLNTEHITRFAPSAEEYARRTFGSWKEAVIGAGIPIEYIELDCQKYARAGHGFEVILGDILEELGVAFKKYHHEKWRPDFVIGNHWIDAKLSQHTVYSSGTLEKYEPHCEELTIVFLRGDENFDKRLTDKTRMISVYKLLKDLPEGRQRHYKDTFNNLLSNELGSQTNDLTA